MVNLDLKFMYNTYDQCADNIYIFKDWQYVIKFLENVHNTYDQCVTDEAPESRDAFNMGAACSTQEEPI